MGTSHSKKLNTSIGKGRHEQYEQESILAAIAVNKRQRKLLLKQVKLAKQNRQTYNTHANDLPSLLPEPMQVWPNEQNYEHLNGASYYNSPSKIGNKQLDNNLIACYSNSCQSLYRGGFNELGVEADRDYVMPRKQHRKKTTLTHRRQPLLQQQALQQHQLSSYGLNRQQGASLEDGYAVGVIGTDSGEFAPADKTARVARTGKATARQAKSGRRQVASQPAERLADPLRVAPIAQQQLQPLDTAPGAMALKRLSRVKGGGGKNLQQKHDILPLKHTQQFPLNQTPQTGSRIHLNQVAAYSQNSISIGSEPNSVLSQSSSSQYSSQSLSSQSQLQFSSQSPNLRLYTDHQQATSQQNQSNNIKLGSQQMFAPARYQRGLAYSEDERRRLGLLGLLPSAVQDLELQVRAVMNFIERTRRRARRRRRREACFRARLCREDSSTGPHCLCPRPALQVARSRAESRPALCRAIVCQC